MKKKSLKRSRKCFIFIKTDFFWVDFNKLNRLSISRYCKNQSYLIDSLIKNVNVIVIKRLI